MSKSSEMIVISSRISGVLSSFHHMISPFVPFHRPCFPLRMGYMAQPDFGPAHIKEIEKKTAEAIDAEGWMHTGDKGGSPAVD